jgi:hypothetical protein
VPHTGYFSERSAHLLLPSLELGNSSGIDGLGLGLNRHTKEADDAQNCYTLYREAPLNGVRNLLLVAHERIGFL